MQSSWYSMTSPTEIVPILEEDVGNVVSRYAYFSLPLSSLIVTVIGSMAARARAASVSASVIVKVASPTVISILSTVLSSSSGVSGVSSGVEGDISEVSPPPSARYAPAHASTTTTAAKAANAVRLIGAACR